MVGDQHKIIDECGHFRLTRPTRPFVQLSQAFAAKALTFPAKMLDPELEAIRQKRLKELAGGEDASSLSSAMPNLGNRPGASAEDEAKAAEQEEIRRTLVSQILDSDSRERLSRIALVRPQRAREIEDMLIRMARTGQLRGRVTEEQLISVLDQIEKAENNSSLTSNSSKKITYIRKEVFDDDDDLDL
ncbi:hypothetical protein O181_014623 [Austropuccinia psidii MF-1]|uniref:Programmed cell death protein 5 n=1 Tax=Austropuccinia psidii MF-1 TaxID=1389203 RepID=A0A9Q3GP72_9BASI|nr:hypothetical protein [Austropuccinia psidii MF-1]